MMEEIALFSLFLLGLSYGSTACMFSCMPFLTPLLIANSSSLRGAMSVMVPFSLGRITSYMIIAVVASYSSILIKNILNDTAIFQFLLGGITMSIAVIIVLNSYKKNSSCCSIKNSPNKSLFGCYFIGASISFNLCLPVMTLIAASANTTSTLEAILYGLWFGFGAVIASFVIFGLIFYKISKKLIAEFSKYKKLIERVAAVMLFLVGLMTING